jgi:nucleoside 2-deoxyribosyltransferase
VAADFASRTRAFAGVAGTTDQDGLLIEDFALADNLMIAGAITASGGRFIAQGCPPERRWIELAAFETCIADLTA